MERPSIETLRLAIRSVPDFPKKGIVFRDITTLLKDPAHLKSAIQQLAEPYRAKHIAKVACIEARGFALGGAIAAELGAGFVPVRKAGKLPAQTVREQYALEYGTDVVEMHRDGISPGERVLVHDDLLATGGTAQAACRLVESVGGKVVGVCFLIELSFLKGRNRLKPYDVFSLVDYAVE
jgi:adenine phosphoribosyltransferase